MEIINAVNLSFKYKKGITVLDNIDLLIERGKKTAILGKNGSGKSTLMKLITGLLQANNGKLLINGYDINSTEGKKYIREHFGIVFQNPDNQFVSPIVEEDIKFGLKNHRISKEEYASRINDSLNKVNLQGYEKKTINTLSGGQKQRAATADILAIHPDIFIFDESTSMLDPLGRSEVLNCIHNLENENKTIIVITQNVDDILDADFIYLFADHKILASGKPDEILTDYSTLEHAGIQIPFPVRVYFDLKKKGINLPFCPLTLEKLAEELCSLN